jgi:hypothetical protein
VSNNHVQLPATWLEAESDSASRMTSGSGVPVIYQQLIESKRTAKRARDRAHFTYSLLRLIVGQAYAYYDPITKSKRTKYRRRIMRLTVEAELRQHEDDLMHERQLRRAQRDEALSTEAGRAHWFG